MTTIRVYATSDTHGQFLMPTMDATTSPTGGLIPTAVLLQDSDPETSIRIDNGDTFVGSRIATWQLATQGEQPETNRVVRALKRIDYDAIIPGNHDFDYGLDTLLSLADAVGSPLVLANVQVHGRENPFLPFLILNRAGLRVAIIGLITGNMQQMTNYDRLHDLTFDDPVDTLQRLLPEVRKHADIVIVSYHGGIERNLHDDSPTQYDTGEDQAWKLLQISGIDGLITGHQHRTIAGKYRRAEHDAPANSDNIANQDPVPYLQPGYGASHIGVLEYTLTREGAVSSREAKLLNIAEEYVRGNISFSQEMVNEIAETERHFEAWLDSPCQLTVEQIHTYLSERFGIPGTVFLTGKGMFVWRDLAEALIPPYQVSVYRMPRQEYDEMVRRLQQTGLRIEAQGIASEDPHPTFVMNGAMLSALETEMQKKFNPKTRILQNPVTNIFDELVAHAVSLSPENVQSENMRNGSVRGESRLGEDRE